MNSSSFNTLNRSWLLVSELEPFKVAAAMDSAAMPITTSARVAMLETFMMMRLIIYIDGALALTVLWFYGDDMTHAIVTNSEKKEIVAGILCLLVFHDHDSLRSEIFLVVLGRQI